MVFSEFLDLLGFPIVEVCDLVFGIPVDMQKFVKLSVDGLGIPVLGALNE